VEDMKLTSKIIKEQAVLKDPDKVFNHKIDGLDFEYKLLTVDSISSIIGSDGKLSKEIVSDILSQSLYDTEEKRLLTKKEIQTFFSGKLLGIAFKILEFILDESGITDLGRETAESFRP